MHIKYSFIYIYENDGIHASILLDNRWNAWGLLYLAGCRSFNATSDTPATLLLRSYLS